MDDDEVLATPESANHEYSSTADDYEIGKAIGFGSSGIVYIALYKPMKKKVAIKMIQLDRFERNQIDALRKEIQVMSLSRHTNILTVYTSFVNESKLWIITPLCSVGSCLDIMKFGFSTGFEEAVIATILYQALLGLDYLHKNGLIHRDVKAGNLLMGEDGLVQLADFGVSSSLADDAGDRKISRKTFVGTPCWMAPEVMEMTKGYDFKADIWSFGITSLELAYGHAPFAKFPPMKNSKVIYYTLNLESPTLDRSYQNRKYSKSFKDFVDLCLQKDPQKRPSAEFLLKHAFLKQAKKPKYLAQAVASLIPHIEERIKPDPISFDDKNDDDEDSWNFSDKDEKEDKEEENKKSRFIVENKTISSVANEDDKSQEASSEIRKGRFHVIEAPSSPVSTSAASEISSKRSSVGTDGNRKSSGVFESPVLSPTQDTNTAMASLALGGAIPSGTSRFTVTDSLMPKVSISSDSTIRPSPVSADQQRNSNYSDNTVKMSSTDSTKGRFKVSAIETGEDESPSMRKVTFAESPESPLDLLMQLNDQQYFILEQEKKRMKNAQPGISYQPFTALSYLEKHIRTLYKENEDLRRENERLRKMIQ